MKALLLVVFGLAACSSIGGFELGERRCESGRPDLGEEGTNACYG
jgi:hypothetical protein